jgi:ribosomal protein S18 acetylase RimI-like enzyme
MVMVWLSRSPLTLGVTLRAFMPTDGTAVVDLVVAAGMFELGEADFLAEGALESSDDGATCLVQDADDGRGLAAVLFYRPEDAADRAFDLTMIAVRPDLQGGGRGAALMRYAEQDLRDRGQRLVVVRTSGTAQYDRTRAFYRGLGYAEHAHVPDYWTDGDDLVFFTKRL